MMGNRRLTPHEGLRAALETACLGALTISLMVQPLPAAAPTRHAANSATPADQHQWKDPMPEEQKALHLLNRITFGPRPGDLDCVQAMGLKAFLEEQLRPERIQDSAVEERVAALPSLSMSSEELAENYPAPAPKPAGGAGAPPVAGVAKPASEQGNPATSDTGKPALRAANAMPVMRPELQGPQRVIMELAQEEVLRAVYSNRQLQELMVQFWMNHFNIFAPKGADRWLTTSFERDTIRPHALGKFEDLLDATAKSPAMLFYLDNWLSATPNPTVTANGQRFGRNVAHGPPARYAVWRPFGGNRSVARGNQVPAQGAQAKRPNRRGLNENYAREVMELHTLGVDGGYTQKDVIEVARCLTGWTIDKPQKGGEFVFRPPMHDFGEKVVLGHKIKAGRGMEDGLEVLHILARQPSTAHFLSLKLCRRFVADDPPPALVDRAAKAFLKTNGDIRQVLKTILTSPEFYSEAAYRAKVKSPLELVVSSVRALSGQTDASVQLVQFIARMGQPMFQYQAPTGFPDRAGTWINPGSMLVRLNFAALFAANRIPGTAIDWTQVAPPADGMAESDTVQEMARQLVGGDLKEKTGNAIQSGLISGTGFQPVGHGQDAHATITPAQREKVIVAGLILASPEFQRR